MDRHEKRLLLRAIEGGGYYPVGDNRTHYSNFRLVAATNRNLREMVAQGLMREDFFFRIHIIPVSLPPLRERKEDVPLLIDYYLARFAAGQPRPVLPGRVLEELYLYDWPGNVRELQNVLRRYLAIKRLDFLGPMGGPASPAAESTLEAGDESGNLAEMMDRHEKRLLLRALERHRWRRGRTAQTLGIDRKTLFLKMRAHGLP
jgi:transcriptional regulator with PAS, ATPase and Fis domain